jgi:hypothetical protein
MISLSAFRDEFVKIAAAGAIKGLSQALARSSGALGKKMVPKARPMTAYFRGGKMVKVPHGSPPPLPAH